MEKFNFGGVKVRIIDCASESVDFRVAEVFDVIGRFVHEIRTSAKGREAAEIAYADALRFRLI